MCSTFKMLLAAAVLQRVDAGKDRLDHLLAIPAKPLVGNSPLTEEHAGCEMAVTALCHAVLTRSDNTAANVLLETIGGPGGMTRFARSIGDRVTRLDRTETALNEARPGDRRDTTSPEAMVGSLRTLLLGKVLALASREQMKTPRTTSPSFGRRMERRCWWPRI
jgi:beta-lactamase class A